MHLWLPKVQSSVESIDLLYLPCIYLHSVSITDELAERERRNNNTIVYKFPEASDHQSHKYSFANFCNSCF